LIVSAHIARAWKLYELRRYAACIEAAQQHLAEVPNDSEAYRLMAHAAADSGDLIAALDAAAQAVALAPSDANAFLALAVANHISGMGGAADAAIREALRLNPEAPRLHEQMARQTILRQDWKSLIAIARDGLAIDPRNDYLRFVQALATSQAISRQLAFQQIEEGLAINPENANLITLKGALLVEGGEVKEGMPHLLDALRITPTSKYAHTQLKYARLAGWYSAIPGWLRKSGCLTIVVILVALYVVSVVAMFLQWLLEILVASSDALPVVKYFHR
jgi:tetratricopeptide (TPR) repeat protein